MSDFHQSGVITTFPRLGKYDLEGSEHTLEAYTAHRPVALVLPCLYSELEGPALHGIVEHLKQVRYVRRIVVGLDRANRKQFEHARRFFGVLPQDVRIVWREGPRVKKLVSLMARKDLSVGGPGKGGNKWLTSGYVLADEECKIIALHDCDVMTYDRELLSRLVFPLASPNMDYEFCKGYYARASDKLYGRVTRLLVTPLIRALQKILGRDVPLLVFLDSFRYPLAGEFSMVADLARVNRIPADWGLEIGVLCEVFRNCTAKRICQVELCDIYEHKHQTLSAGNDTKGLMKMSADISKSLFRNLAMEGVVLSEALFRSLTVRYLQVAHDTVKQYEDVAALNGLPFDRHQELLAVSAFNKSIRAAAHEFLKDPFGIPLISNWNRVTSAIPGVLESLREAVDLDNGRK